VGQIVTLLAAMKAGGAFLPLDPVQPKRYLCGLLADAATGIVVSNSKYSAKLCDSRWKFVDIDAPSTRFHRC
jgi:non-ribosomal peptide synthetase component F